MQHETNGFIRKKISIDNDATSSLDDVIFNDNNIQRLEIYFPPSSHIIDVRKDWADRNTPEETKLNITVIAGFRERIPRR